jgi:hypothetical protein
MIIIISEFSGAHSSVLLPLMYPLTSLHLWVHALPAYLPACVVSGVVLVVELLRLETQPPRADYYTICSYPLGFKL